MHATESTHAAPSEVVIHPARAHCRSVFVRPPRRSPVRRSRRRAGSVAVPSTGRRTVRALASDLGQGTVEYVGLLLLMASVLAAVVAASKTLGGNDQIGKQVVTQVGESIKIAGGKGER